MLAYGSFNRGFKSGGFNAGLPGSDPSRPEALNAYEAGLKMNLAGRRIRLNVAGFYYDYKDIQIQNLDASGIIFVIIGTKATLYGLDVDATFRVTNDLTLTAALGLTSTKFKSFPVCLISAPAGGLAASTGSPWQARFFSISEPTITSSCNSKINLNANAYYNGGYFPESDNVLRQPSFWKFGASVKWTDRSGIFFGRRNWPEPIEQSNFRL